MIIFILFVSTGSFILHVYNYADDFKDEIPLNVELNHIKTPTIKAVGKALYDCEGNYIQLKGIDFGNWSIQEGWMTVNSLGAKYNDDGSFAKVNEEGIVEEYEEVTQEEL